LSKNVPLASILKNLFNKWLKSGIIFQQGYKITYAGVPRGDIISSVLCNFVLDGLEEKVKRSGNSITKFTSSGITIRYKNTRGKAIVTSKLLQLKTIRYAGDFIVFGKNRRILKIIKLEVSNFCQERGLVLAQENTRILNF
jgi:retron-type reverse transcriptase